MPLKQKDTAVKFDQRRNSNRQRSGRRDDISAVMVTLLVVLVLSGCEGFSAAPVEFGVEDVVTVGSVETIEIRGTVLTSLPKTRPEVDAQRAELGRLLFWDPILSGDRDIACATCHLPALAYSDGLKRSIGTGGAGRGTDRITNGVVPVPRNAQTLINVVWNGINEAGLFDPRQAPMFWDNRATGLREQAIEPLLSAQEMRGGGFTRQEILPELVSRLNNNDEYVQLFRQAYEMTGITDDLIADALATFQSTLIASNSAFDKWMRGDSDAMSDRQVSGMQEFVIAGCAECHSGPLFSDFELHVLGVQEAKGLAVADDGDGNFAFRTPTLRQLKFTAPYFHGGQFGRLSSAVNFYDDPDGSSNPLVPRSSLDEDFLAIPEMEDGRGAIIIEFLNALNDEDFDKQIPSAVPSGLPPGGFTE